MGCFTNGTHLGSPSKLHRALGVCLMSMSDRAPISKTGSPRFNRATLQMNAHLLPEEKLEILRATDLRRKWHSLDDQRVCVLCDRTITGRQIEVKREPFGTFSLHCPTEGCPSVANDWFYLGNACSSSKGANVRTTEVSIWDR